MGFKLALSHLFVFGCGILAWVAITRGLPMTAVLCLILTLFAVGVGAGRAGPGRIEVRLPVTTAIDRQRLLALLDLAPTPMVLRDGSVFFALNRAARDLFATDGVIADAGLLAGAFEQRYSDSKVSFRGLSFSLVLADIAADDGGEPQRLGVLADITAEVRAAQAAALRDLLQILNHELMNSLTPITSLAQTAADLLSDDTPASRNGAQQAIRLVAQRSAELVHFAESYRAMAKLPSPNRQKTNAGPWAQQIAQLARARWDGSTVGFEVSVEDPELGLQIDSEQMTQVVINLLANAFDAAKAQGGDARVRLAVSIEDDRPVLSVEDSGAGVPDALKDSVFMPFFTTKASGSGIGLALSRQIVVNHGGDIRLERSPILGGAKFSVLL